MIKQGATCLSCLYQQLYLIVDSSSSEMGGALILLRFGHGINFPILPLLAFKTPGQVNDFWFINGMLAMTWQSSLHTSLASIKMPLLNKHHPRYHHLIM